MTKLDRFKVTRRVACKGYPLTEARYTNLLEYILTLEKEVASYKAALEDIAEPRPCTSEDAVIFQHWAQLILKED